MAVSITRTEIRAGLLVPISARTKMRKKLIEALPPRAKTALTTTPDAEEHILEGRQSVSLGEYSCRQRYFGTEMELFIWEGPDISEPQLASQCGLPRLLLAIQLKVSGIDFISLLDKLGIDLERVPIIKERTALRPGGRITHPTTSLFSDLRGTVGFADYSDEGYYLVSLIRFDNSTYRAGEEEALKALAREVAQQLSS